MKYEAQSGTATAAQERPGAVSVDDKNVSLAGRDKQQRALTKSRDGSHAALAAVGTMSRARKDDELDDHILFEDPFVLRD
jgi:hypothetical protein